MFGLETTASLWALIAFSIVNIATGLVFGKMLSNVSTLPPIRNAYLGLLLSILQSGPIIVTVFFLTGNWWLLIVVSVTDFIFIVTYTLFYQYLKYKEGVTWQ